MNEQQTNSHERLAYSVREVAAMLNLSTKSIYRLAHRNLLPPNRGVRHLRFTRQAIEKYLTETS